MQISWVKETKLVFSETIPNIFRHICDELCSLLPFKLGICVWEIHLKANWMLWPIFPSISCSIWTFKFIPSHMMVWDFWIKLARGDSFMFVLIWTHWEGNYFCSLLLRLYTFGFSYPFTPKFLSRYFLPKREQLLPFKKQNRQMNHQVSVYIREKSEALMC